MLGRLLASSWVPMGATAAVFLVLLGQDVPVVDLGMFVAYVALTVALPGVFAWRLLLRHLHTDTDEPPTWFEDLSLGTIFGFGVQLPLYLLGVWVGFPPIVWVLPIVVLALGTRGIGRMVWALPTRSANPALSWGLAVVIGYGLLWLRHRFSVSGQLSLPANRPPGLDETFHVALVGELSHRFPPEIPYLLGTRLDYHWFVHAQIAAGRWATGVDAQALLRQLMPATLLTLTVLGLGAVALRLTGRPVAAFIAPALLVAGAFHLFGPDYIRGSVTEPFLIGRYITSPSQSYGVMMSMPALMLILEVLRPDRRATKMTWLTLAAALLALSGSKATFLPIFLCGAIAVWALQLLWQRSIDRRATLLVVLLALVTVFAQQVLFGGQTGGMAVDFFGTVEVTLRAQGLQQTVVSSTLMTAALLVGWLLYGVGVVGLALERRWRDPRAIWMLVCIPAGITVAFVFFRIGLSQLWFQRSVAELVALVSAWGAAWLLPNPLPQRTALRLLAVACAAGLGAFAVSVGVEAANDGASTATLGSLLLTTLAPLVVVGGYVLVRLRLGGVGGHRRPGPTVCLALLLGLGLTNVFAFFTTDTSTPRPLAKVPVLFAAGGAKAAEYIEAHSDPDDVVATNMHCRLPDARRCDNRHFWLSAFSQRRVVIEGWGYTAATNENFVSGQRNRTISAPFPERRAINDAAFERPSARSVGRLVDTYDVRWLFVSTKYPADVDGLSQLSPVLSEVFRNNSYVVFEVSD